MNKIPKATERGSARLKFMLVVGIIALGIYASYLFIPVAYQAYLLKDLMQHHVDIAAAMGHPPTWVKDQLVKSGPEYGIPADAAITATKQDNRVEARVQFTRPIAFPGYTYNYEFDHTARSATFLSVK
ncbi:MAG: hypothetical protein ABR501_04255 [Pyrinomonadaceae bacterium]